MITAFRRCREYNSAPSCLIVSGTQKQKIILRSRESSSRLEKEKPILEAFWNWLDQQRPNKGTRLAKAVNYAQNRKDTLMTYLEDGHCSLSNNLSENAIRPFTVGAEKLAVQCQSEGSLPLALLCIQWLRWQKRMT